MRINWTKVRPKSSNNLTLNPIAPYLAPRTHGVMLWAPMGCGFVRCSPHGLSLRLAMAGFAGCSEPLIKGAPGVSGIRGSPLQLQFHPHRACLWRLWSLFSPTGYSQQPVLSILWASEDSMQCQNTREDDGLQVLPKELLELLPVLSGLPTESQ